MKLVLTKVQNIDGSLCQRIVNACKQLTFFLRIARDRIDLEYSGRMDDDILKGEIPILRQEALRLTSGIVDGEDFPSTFLSTSVNGIQKVHEPIGLQIVGILVVHEERLGSAIIQ